MARQPMVTRTIITTEATIMCVNIESKQVEEVTITLPRTYKDDKAILRYIEKHPEGIDSKFKPVSVTASQKSENLYGMTEAEFVKVAQKMDSRFAKLQDNTSDDTDDTDDDDDTDEEAPENKQEEAPAKTPKKPKK